jgi:hypothetical protein
MSEEHDSCHQTDAGRNAYCSPPLRRPRRGPQVAVEKAEAGEEITFATAKEIVAQAKKKRRLRRQKPVPDDKLGLRLMKWLERYKERWNPKELSELACQLRELMPTRPARTPTTPVAEPEHEEWVMQEWKRFQGVSP